MLFCRTLNFFNFKVLSSFSCHQRYYIFLNTVELNRYLQQTYVVVGNKLLPAHIELKIFKPTGYAVLTNCLESYSEILTYLPMYYNYSHSTQFSQ